jgi:hypothetical protein
MLKKMNFLITYLTREAQAFKTVKVVWERCDFKISDNLAKLMAGPRFWTLVKMFLHWI